MSILFFSLTSCQTLQLLDFLCQVPVKSYKFYGLKWTRTTLRRTAILCVPPALVALVLFRKILSDLYGLKWTRTTDLALIRRAL